MEQHVKAEQTILVVDSDHDFLAWITKHLEITGEVKVLRCDNTQKALKVIEKTQVDLLLSDLIIQPIDGIELLRRAKATDKSTVVILYSNSPSTSQIIDATQQGARDVLKKEALSFDLRNAVEDALQ